MSSAGKLTDADVNVVGADIIRLDLFCYTPNESPEEKRRNVMLSTEDAMALVILLIRAIEQAEVNSAVRSKKPSKQTELPLKKGKP